MITINKLENITFKVKDDKGNKLLGSIILDFEERRIDCIISNYATSLDSEYGNKWSGDSIRSKCPKTIHVHHTLHHKHYHDSDETFMTIKERKLCLKDTISCIERYIKEILLDLRFNFNNEELLINYPNFSNLKSIKELIEETDFYREIFTKYKPSKEWSYEKKELKRD